MTCFWQCVDGPWVTSKYDGDATSEAKLVAKLMKKKRERRKKRFKVRRCKLTLSNPRCNRLELSA